MSDPQKQSMGCLAGIATTLAFVLGALVQFCGLVYAGYHKFYRAAAEAPGARDGMGLILVMGAVILGAAVLTTVLCIVEATIIRKLLPGWEPPDPDDF